MTESGVRYIVGNGKIDIADLPATGMTRGGKAVKEKRTYTRKQAQPANTVTTLYGFKIENMPGLGMHGKPDKKSFWNTMLGALAVGQGFEVNVKDFNRAKQAIRKANKNATKIWKQSRKFVFEDINSKGEVQAGVGRVGRIK